MKFIDLFAGVGGFHLALESLGGECVFASEWDPKARTTYSLNFPGNYPFAGDLTKVKSEDIPAHDVLCAGFPCQPFSIAGAQRGFEHPTQGTLFFEIERILKDKKPAVIFLENVKNLKSHDDGKTFTVIKEALTDLGYHLKDAVLDADTHGNLPQNRERIYIVGFLDKEKADKFEFPARIPLTTQLVPDMIDIARKADEKYYMTNKDSPSIKKMLEGVVKKGVIYQYRRYYMRENKTGVCPTLTANMGTGGHNVPLILDNFGVRKLTPRECFSLQGFPEHYQFPAIADSSLYKQAGNSVPVPVINRIYQNILIANQ